MKLIWRRTVMIIVLILVVIVLAGCALLPRFLFAPGAPDAVNSIEDVEKYIGKNLEFGTPPGVSIVVVKDGKPVYEKSIGKDLGNEISAQSVFHWWSVTKVFTAISVLQLFEKGMVDLDDPIQKYLPDLKAKSQIPGIAESDITISRLLSHSAGIGDAMPDMMTWIHYSPADHINQSDLLKRMWPQYGGIIYTPGKEARYSNLGYIILGALVERVSEVPYEEYVEKNILDKLDMKSSAFTYNETMRKNMIHGSHPIDLMGLMVSGKLDMKKAVNSTVGTTWWFNELYTDYTPPSGLLSSTADIAKFLNFLLSGNDGSIISRESLRLMEKPIAVVTESPAPADNLKMGLSWFVMDLDKDSGRTAVVHGGNGMSQVAFVGLVPGENLGIAIAANSTYFGRDFGLSLFTMLANIEW